MSTQTHSTDKQISARSGKSGFTLIEILIVVVLLGIMAAMVIPKFSNAAAESRESMLLENLRILKAQIGVYRAQHWDVAPGYPNGDTTNNPTEADFVAQLTLYSDEDGVTNGIATDRFKYGPYMREIPDNPINGLPTVDIINDGGALPGVGDDSHGWTYRPEDLTVLNDASGTDSHGEDYYNY